MVVAASAFDKADPQKTLMVQCNTNVNFISVKLLITYMLYSRVSSVAAIATNVSRRLALAIDTARVLETHNVAAR